VRDVEQLTGVAPLVLESGPTKPGGQDLLAMRDRRTSRSARTFPALRDRPELELVVDLRPRSLFPRNCNTGTPPGRCERLVWSRTGGVPRCRTGMQSDSSLGVNHMAPERRAIEPEMRRIRPPVPSSESELPSRRTRPSTIYVPYRCSRRRTRRSAGRSVPRRDGLVSVALLSASIP